VKFGMHFKRAGQLAGVSGAGQVVSYVLFIVLARHTSVSAFEDYAVAVGAGTLLASLTTLGLEKYSVRILPVFYEREDWAGARGYFGFSLRRILCASVVAGLALALGWGWYDPWSASWAAVAVAALVLPLLSLADLAVEVLAAGGHELRGALFHRVGVFGAALAFVFLAFQLPIALSGAGAVACWGLGWGFALVWMAREVRRTTPAGVWGSSAREDLGWQREALPFLGLALALNFIAQAGVLGLEFLGASEIDLGAYAAATQTASLIVVLATATNRFYSPRLALFLERGDFVSLEILRRQRIRWLLPLVVAFVIAVFSFGREILELFRPEFLDDGVPVLRIIAFPIAFSVLFSMAPTYLNRARPECRCCSWSPSCRLSELPARRSPMRQPWVECTRCSSPSRISIWQRNEPGDRGCRMRHDGWRGTAGRPPSRAGGRTLRLRTGRARVGSPPTIAAPAVGEPRRTEAAGGEVVDKRNISMRVFPLVVMALVVGCASTKAPTQAKISQEVVLASSVRAVNAETREITLERKDGTTVVIVAGPEVRNFAQIEVGDTVKARYRESLSALRLKPGEVEPDPVAEIAVGVAEPGGKPGVGIGTGAIVVVTVESVDTKSHIVVFSGPTGGLRSVRAQRDEGRRFISGLKRGDRVKLVYTEAVALTVEE